MLINYYEPSFFLFNLVKNPRSNELGIFYLYYSIAANTIQIIITEINIVVVFTFFLITNT